MARSLFNEEYIELSKWFSLIRFPNIHCGTCKNGYLVLEKSEDTEFMASRKAREHDDWYPDWISGLFTAKLVCTAPKCREATVGLGEFRYVEAEKIEDGHLIMDFEKQFIFKTLLPSSPLIFYPDGCPQTVKDLLDEASYMLLNNPGAAANRIRTAIDELLTALKVKRYQKVKGKLIKLDTHSRITAFKEINSTAASTLEAVKWIGNEGSHNSTLSVVDALDGAELLAFALGLLYDTNSRTIQRKAKQINAKKGVSKKS